MKYTVKITDKAGQDFGLDTMEIKRGLLIGDRLEILERIGKKDVKAK